MQSVNAIRLVLGTMLGVTDDPTSDEVDEQLERSPEYHLYAYLAGCSSTACAPPPVSMSRS